jgi:hypothetical protein
VALDSYDRKISSEESRHGCVLVEKSRLAFSRPSASSSS